MKILRATKCVLCKKIEEILNKIDILKKIKIKKQKNKVQTLKWQAYAC